MRWKLSKELSPEEQKVANRLRKSSKFFRFLLEKRAEIFDEAFQAELEGAHKPFRGKEPIPPAKLAMIHILQGYTHLSDADAVEAAEHDLRWKLVLGDLGKEKASFGQGSLVRFRMRMIEHNLDQKILDRTVELAKKTCGFGWQHLKATFDSSPLRGAGRVEDTWNLIGRAIKNVVHAICVALDVDETKVIEETQLTCIRGPSVKAILDIDWDDPAQKHEALQTLLAEAERLTEWIQEYALPQAQEPPLKEALDDLVQVIEQDLEPDPDGNGMKVAQGVAKDRMPSLGDKEMRHGRKTRTKPFTGYKRHIVRAIGMDVILGGVVRPANEPEHLATQKLLEDVNRHGHPSELYFDRGYLASSVIQDFVKDGGEIYCKPFQSNNRGYFTKDAFEIDLEQKQVTCPAGEVVEFKSGGRKAQFSPTSCNVCTLLDQCTRSKNGRTISIHQQEDTLMRLRARKKTPEGRDKLRKRIVVEHSLVGISRIQGPRARYVGERKNTMDLRRASVICNLQYVQRVGTKQPVLLAA